MAPQVGSLFQRQLEHEILWKTASIAFDRAVQSLGFDSVKPCEVSVQQHLFAAREMNQPFDLFNRDQLCGAPGVESRTSVNRQTTSRGMGVLN